MPDGTVISANITVSVTRRIFALKEGLLNITSLAVKRFWPLIETSVVWPIKIKSGVMLFNTGGAMLIMPLVTEMRLPTSS